MTIGRPKVGPYLFDHNVVVFKCGICQRQNEIRPKVKAARDNSSDPGAKPPDQKASDQDQSVALGAFMPPPLLGEVTLLRWWGKMQKIQDLKGNFLK